MTRENNVKKQKTPFYESHEDYFRRVLVKEQPFYRPGMTEKEIDIELEYMNQNINSVIEGHYLPLWKQQLYY